MALSYEDCRERTVNRQWACFIILMVAITCHRGSFCADFVISPQLLLWIVGEKRTDWTDFSDWLVCLVCLVYPRFFLEQNNRIFQTLSEVAGSPDPTVTQETVRAMGLDPHGDRLFLLHLLEIYGYDTLLVSEQLCCSWESPLLVLEGGLTCLEPTESAALHGVFRTVWASRNVSGAFVRFVFYLHLLLMFAVVLLLHNLLAGSTISQLLWYKRK